ncbi:lytic transglycosylase domain-containing protein [Agromyces terreus]|uniref:lytic transglycosylase domain-containing protein n=1 Tax=Agromyces terreus TaxID=424795 RepID=UPI0031CFC9F9
MFLDDDLDADEHGGPRPARQRVTGWRVLRLAAAYTGAVVGVVALVVGVVVAVNMMGTATNPGGFAAPAAGGPRAALPPTVELPEPVAGTGEAEVDAVAEPAPLEEPTELSGAAPGATPIEIIDEQWIATVAASTGIPERALTAYALAHVLSSVEEPDCGLDWATIAAIGRIESGHAGHGSTVLDENGSASPPIIGRALDGRDTAKIADTDGGRFDGDTTWDRAVGPMQFIPSTWAKWGADANGDGIADPNQIDDAALATARYLCASGPMTSVDGWRAAVFSYNHDNDYVDEVAKVALEYAESAG